MLDTKNKPLITICDFRLLVPWLNDPFFLSTPHMKRCCAVFPVTLDARTTVFPLDLANTTCQGKIGQRHFSLNFESVPHIFHDASRIPLLSFFEPNCVEVVNTCYMEPFSSRHLDYNALKLWAKLAFSLMQGNLVEKDLGAPITEPLLNLILLAPYQVPTVA